MIQQAAQVVPLKLNSEKDGKALAEKYRVRGLPTILFIDKDGEVHGRINGYLPPDAFSDEMAKVQVTYKELPRIQELLKQNPDDGEANAKLCIVHAFRGKIAEAEEALKKAEKSKYAGENMSRAYYNIGDYYQGVGKANRAITYFKKASDVAVKTSDKAYAKMSLMFCYDETLDKKLAKKVAEEILAMKDAPSQYVEEAQAYLKGE